MKIKDIITKLDKSENNSEWVDVSGFETELGLDGMLWNCDHNKGAKHIKCYWLAKHYCTDTYVGLRAYFLDDELVCISSQRGRKCSKDFEWVSKETFESVKSFILSLIDDNESETIILLDMDEDLGDFYHIHYSGQFLRKEVKYKGEDVLITKQSRSYEDMDHVTIKRKDGTEERVLSVDIETPWNILE